MARTSHIWWFPGGDHARFRPNLAARRHIEASPSVSVSNAWSAGVRGRSPNPRSLPMSAAPFSRFLTALVAVLTVVLSLAGPAAAAPTSEAATAEELGYHP